MFLSSPFAFHHNDAKERKEGGHSQHVWHNVRSRIVRRTLAWGGMTAVPWQGYNAYGWITSEVPTRDNRDCGAIGIVEMRNARS
jgi:hypothetical protein